MSEIKVLSGTVLSGGSEGDCSSVCPPSEDCLPSVPLSACRRPACALTSTCCSVCLPLFSEGHLSLDLGPHLISRYFSQVRSHSGWTEICRGTLIYPSTKFLLPPFWWYWWHFCLFTLPYLLYSYPPLSVGIHTKAPSGCLKPQILPNTIHTHIYDKVY